MPNFPNTLSSAANAYGLGCFSSRGYLENLKRVAMGCFPTQRSDTLSGRNLQKVQASKIKGRQAPKV